jgi:hypothetical protein
MPAFKETEPAPPSLSLWERVKATILRATPAPADPPGDRQVTAWLKQQARLNDHAMPPAVPRPSSGMVISAEVLKAFSVPTAVQHDFTRHLQANFPRTPPAALPPETPQGPVA